MMPDLRGYLALRAAAKRRCAETTLQVLRHIAEELDPKVAKRIVKKAHAGFDGATRAWFERLAQ